MTQYAAVKTADIDPGVCGAWGLISWEKLSVNKTMGYLPLGLLLCGNPSVCTSFCLLLRAGNIPRKPSASRLAMRQRNGSRSAFLKVSFEVICYLAGGHAK